MDQLDYLKLFSSAVSVQGKDILEIGGAIPPKEALSLNVKSWTSIDINERRFNTEDHAYINDSRYKTILMGAEDMSFNDCQFDAIFSGNCFEHISDLSTALKEIHRVLRKNGVLFSKFSPIWSGPDGHHTWIHEGDHVIAFWQPGGVFPDWYHLSMSAEELEKHLDGKYKPETVKAIIQYVYHSNDLNRWLDSQFLKEMKNLNYHTIINYAIKSKNKPSSQQLALMRERYPKAKDFRTQGFYWLLAKSKPTLIQYIRGYFGSAIAILKIKLARKAS